MQTESVLLTGQTANHLTFLEVELGALILCGAERTAIYENVKETHISFSKTWELLPSLVC